MGRETSFEDILVALQQAALQPDHWPVASGLIEKAIGAKGNALMVCSHPAYRPDAVCFWRIVFGGERYADLEHEFIEDHWQRDERIPRVRRLADGVLVPTSDLYTAEERETSPTYTELMGRTDMQAGLHTRLDVPDGLQIVWALGESTGGGWTTRQVAVIEKLMRHLRYFASVRQVLADAQALAKSLTGLLDDRRLSVIQLDRTGRILEANDHAAELLLQKGGGLLDAAGHLRAGAPEDNAQLQRVLADAIQGAAGSITVGRSARSRLLLHVTPVPEQEAGFRVVGRVAALVLIVDPERRPVIDPKIVAETLNLTPAEARVAAMLATGYSVKGIVEATHRSENTVRSQLKQVFRKQGIASQADLVRRVLALDGRFPPD